MSIVSYAQNFEDVLLWRALHDVQQGRYIDIGAHDPFVDSVSRAFYEAGWRGMHVEPLPDYAAKLREARPQDVVIEAAVTNAAGPIPFYELSGLSSGRKDIAEHHERRGHVTREILVPTVRLDHLLKLAGPDIHWLKIDVEGMEADVLRSWGKSAIRPWVLVIEATFPTTQESAQHLWSEEVSSRGYNQVFFDGLSSYFVHESHRDLAEQFSVPANYFDQFSIPSEHFSAEGIKTELARAERRFEEERARTEGLNIELRDVWQAHNALREEQRRALEQLISAEQEHRTAVDALLLAGRDTEQRQELLHRALREAEAALAAARVEGARFEERSAQLQNQLNSANAASLQVERRFDQVEQQLIKERAAHEQARSHFDQKAAAFVRERDEAEQKFQRQTADDRVAHERALSDLQQQLTTLVRERDEAQRNFERQVAEDRAIFEQTQGALGQQIAALAGERDQARREAAEGELALAALYASTRGKIASWLGLLPIRAGNRAATEVEAPQLPPNPNNKESSANARHETEFNVEDVRHTSNLLALNGSAFIDALYRVFLKRSPDRHGRDHFVGRLQAGHSKEAVLLAIATSPEAKAVGAPVEGVAELEKTQRTWSFFGQSRQSRALDEKLGRLEYNLGEAHNMILDRLDRIEVSLDQIYSNLAGLGPYRGVTSDAVVESKDRAPASIKRGLSVGPSSSASEFIDSLKREVQSSSEALTLSKNN